MIYQWICISELAFRCLSCSRIKKVCYPNCSSDLSSPTYTHESHDASFHEPSPDVDRSQPARPGWKGIPPCTARINHALTAQVFLVTGATSGYGLLLSTILYQHNAKVYLAARNTKKITEVIDDLKQQFPNSKGDLHPIGLDLSDLSTIKKSADEFLSKESQLNVLFNNAGVMFPPEGARTTQGFELQLGTNCVGPHLFTKLLYPTLAQTAKTAPADTVRIVWVASDAVSWAPKPAIDFNNLDYRKDENARMKYGRSKAGTILQAVEMGKRGKEDGVVSIVGFPPQLHRNILTA